MGHSTLCPRDPGNEFFNHGEIAYEDNCITGFVRVRRDLVANNRA